MSDTTKSGRPFLLIGSLILNGLLVGLLIGGGLRGQGNIPAAPDRGERAMVRGLERSVDDSERAVVRDALRQAFRATRSERQTLSQARRALREAIVADPYDATSVERAFQAVREAEAASKQGLHGELARQFERLTPEQRETVLRSMERQPRRGQRGDRRGEGQRRQDRPQRSTDN